METKTKELPFRRYICETCGFIFDEELGDPVGGIAPGTRWEDIPDDWICSLCGDAKSEFSLMDAASTASAGKATASAVSTDIVVIGSGYAGWRVTEAVRALSDSASITMLTKSAGDYYNRTQLSKKIGDKQENFTIQDANSSADKFGVNLISDCEVIGIEKHKKLVITNSGIFSYDKLVIAAGSTTSQLFETAVPNVYTIDQIEQYDLFAKDLSVNDKIAVVGGGLIGCEVADSLRSNNYEVTVINRKSHLLNSLIPKPVAERMQQTFEGSGIRVLNNIHVKDVAQKGGRVECELSDDTVQMFDKIILCTGTTAITDFATRAGFKTGEQGIVVNEYLSVDNNDIYALGDCVEFNGLSYRYLSSINNQADVIANELIHNDQKHKFSNSSNVVKVKTPSFPITIYQHAIGEEVESWNSLEDDMQGIKVELLSGNNIVGVVEAGYAH